MDFEVSPLLLVFQTIITALATLGAVWLTNRHNAKLAQVSRDSERLAEERDQVTSLLTNMKLTAEQDLLLVPAYSKFSEKDHIEFADTDSGKEQRRLNGEITRLLAILRVRLPASDFRAALLKVHDDGVSARHGIFPKLLKGDGKAEDIIEGIRAMTSHSARVSQVQNQAAEHFARELGLNPVTPWWKKWLSAIWLRLFHREKRSATS